MKKIIMTLLLISFAAVANATAPSPGGYCLAVRGNGQSQPAHWGALARTVEQLGLPQAMAGGSSATVSMLLLEAMASHPMIKGQSPEVQKARASLLVKSLLGFFSEVQKTQSWEEIRKLYASYEKIKDLEVLRSTKEKIDLKQLAAAKKLITEAINLGLLDPRAVAPLISALQKEDLPRAHFYLAQLKQTAELFGQFKPDDKNIFFRAGVVNFEKAAETFGRIASFYAAEKSSSQDIWQSFMKTCAPASVGLTWVEIITKTPQCGTLFQQLFAQHFSENPGATKYEERLVGSQFQVFPATAVLTGKSVEDFKAALVDYHQNMNVDIGEKFRVQETDEVKFGYWGEPEALKEIATKLDMQDAKSQRFLGLGQATWKEVLSLSPAEPGLAPLQPFTTASGQEYVSAGGWSDLHPVLVLKAAGCQEVVYITRTGGESLFAQGIAKRLLGWKKDSVADHVAWSALYDFDNPKSSYAKSVASASAVLCTNWDSFSVPQDIGPLIEDSYRSSYWVNPVQGLSKALTPVLSEKKIGCTP